MKKLIRANLAGNILLAAMALLLIFHVLVVLRVIPAEIVWGGQLRGVPANLIALEIVAARLGYIRAGKLSGAVNIGVWLIFAYLVLNTVGNLASGVSFEKLLFAPLTIFLAFCALRLAIEKQ